MRPLIVALMAVFCLWTLIFSAGCDQIAGMLGSDPPASNARAANASQLVGMWIAADGTEPVAGEIGQRMQQGFDQNALKLQFGEAGQLTVYRGIQPVQATPYDASGKWQVTGRNGNDLVVRLSAPGLSADETPTDFVVTFPDENHFTLRAADAGTDGLAFTFTRQSPRMAAR